VLLLGGLEHREVPVGPQTDGGEHEEADEKADAHVGPDQEVEALSLGPAEGARGAAVAEAAGNNGAEKGTNSLDQIDQTTRTEWD
jgi:hypothetical protein